MRVSRVAIACDIARWPEKLEVTNTEARSREKRSWRLWKAPSEAAHLWPSSSSAAGVTVRVSRRPVCERTAFLLKKAQFIKAKLPRQRVPSSLAALLFNNNDSQPSADDRTSTFNIGRWVLATSSVPTYLIPCIVSCALQRHTLRPHWERLALWNPRDSWARTRIGRPHIGGPVHCPWVRAAHSMLGLGLAEPVSHTSVWVPSAFMESSRRR